MIGRRFAIPLVVVGAVAAGGVAGAIIGVPGLSGASTPTATQTPTQPAAYGGHAGCGPKEYLDAAAKVLNLTTEELRQKLSDGKTTIADVAGQQHVDVDDVVNAISAADQQCVKDFVNNPLPVRGHGPGKGNGSAVGRLGLGDELDAAAKALGMQPSDLLQELRDGKTIAQVAHDKNVDVNNVIDAMVAAANARIDNAKDAGKLTEDQANNLKSKVKDAITKAVNGQLGTGHFGFGFGRMHGRMGMGGPSTSP